MTRYHTKATVDENGKQTGQENVPFTVEEEAEADANDVASAAAYAEYVAKDKYKDDRRSAYPEIGDQLDDIYHNGIDGWKSTIKAVKDKYAKP